MKEKIPAISQHEVVLFNLSICGLRCFFNIVEQNKEGHENSHDSFLDTVKFIYKALNYSTIILV